MPIAPRRVRRIPFASLAPLLILLVLPGAALAQGQQGCLAPEYRQFDFWVGDWTVTTPKGTLAGTNRIESILGGCVLQEHWASSNGGDGTSLNMWNAADSTWRQVWMDAGGNLLELKGRLEGGSMVLTGTHATPGKPGSATIERVTWTPRDGGAVRQHWEASTDGGATWATQFDGLYQRK
jgi:hypothetical protein